MSMRINNIALREAMAYLGEVGNSSSVMVSRSSKMATLNLTRRKT
jgi:hypothetical protein